MSSSTRRLLAFSLLLLLLLQGALAQKAHSNAEAQIYWSDAEVGTISRADLAGGDYEVLFIDPTDSPRGIALDVPGQKLYAITGHPGGYWTISRGDLDGQNMETLEAMVDELVQPNALTIDHQGGRILWTDSARDVIGQANLDGSNAAVHFSPGPRDPSGIALDPVHGKLYWSDYGEIYRSNLDGSATQTISSSFVTRLPVGLAVDYKNNKLYFTQSNNIPEEYAIVQTNLDGSDEQIVFFSDIARSGGIALDLVEEKMYWTEGSGAAVIHRANLDGSDVESVVTGVPSPLGIALDLFAKKMYWASWEMMEIWSADLDGSNVQAIVDTRPEHPRHVAVDPENGKVYWTGDGGDAVWQANVDGSSAEPLIGGGPVSTRGLALDQTGGRLYWANKNTETISRANLDGFNIEDVLTQRLIDPQGIAIDEVAGKMYFADFGTDQILRANLDSSGLEVLLQSGLAVPTSMALDTTRGKMYWTDVELKQIGRANLDGSEAEVLLSAADGLRNPNVVTVDSETGKLYWTDYGSKRLGRANLDGSNAETLFYGVFELPSGLALSRPPFEVRRLYLPLVHS